MFGRAVLLVFCLPFSDETERYGAATIRRGKTAITPIKIREDAAKTKRKCTFGRVSRSRERPQRRRAGRDVRPTTK